MDLNRLGGIRARQLTKEIGKVKRGKISKALPFVLVAGRFERVNVETTTTGCIWIERFPGEKKRFEIGFSSKRKRCRSKVF